jgi:hypothetical protein
MKPNPGPPARQPPRFFCLKKLDTAAPMRPELPPQRKKRRGNFRPGDARATQ